MEGGCGRGAGAVGGAEGNDAMVEGSTRFTAGGWGWVAGLLLAALPAGVCGQVPVAHEYLHAQWISRYDREACPAPPLLSDATVFDAHWRPCREPPWMAWGGSGDPGEIDPDGSRSRRMRWDERVFSWW